MSSATPSVGPYEVAGSFHTAEPSGEAADAEPNDADDSRLQPIAAKLLSVMDIPNDLLASFIAFYHQYIGSGGDVRRLSNLDLRMAAVQPSALGQRRKSSVRRPSTISAPEQVEMTATSSSSQFDFKKFVTQMREEFWENNEDREEVTTRRREPKFKQWKFWPSGPWSTVLKEIEGRYGAAVMSYFSFLQHIMIVNVAVFFLMLLVIVPHYALSTSRPPLNTSPTVKTCSAKYTNNLLAQIEGSEWFDYPVYLFTGTGILEKNVFYGMLQPYYEMLILGKPAIFNMSLTMAIVPFLCLLVSLVLIIARASVYLSSSIRASKQIQSSKYTVQILSSWKHSVIEPKACILQNQLIRNKLLNMLAKDASQAKSRARNFLKTVLLIVVRVIASILVIALLACCGILVFLVQIFSEERLESVVGVNRAAELALSYLPSFTVTALYLLAGLLFELIVKLESYSREVTMTVTIVRAAALRVASLVLLFATFFADSWTCKDAPSVDGSFNSTMLADRNVSIDAAAQISPRVCGNCRATDGRQQTYCWETYVGQQLYKLVIVDFLMVLVSVFLIETPWRWFHEKFKDRFFIVARIGLPELDIPKLILDVAYTQTLCWVSTLFCPFIPAMTLATTVLLFYSKKYSIRRNFKFAGELSSSSEVRVVFLLLLCPFLILSLAIIIVCVIFLPQSQGCGPFRELADNQHMINAISLALSDYPAAADVFNVITDLKFLIGVIAIMSIFIYYNKAVAHGTDRLIELLEESTGRMIKDNKALWAAVHGKTKQLVEGDERRRRPAAAATTAAYQSADARPQSAVGGGSGLGAMTVATASVRAGLPRSYEPTAADLRLEPEHRARRDDFAGADALSGARMPYPLYPPSADASGAYQYDPATPSTSAGEPAAGVVSRGTSYSPAPALQGLGVEAHEPRPTGYAADPNDAPYPKPLRAPERGPGESQSSRARATPEQRRPEYSSVAVDPRASYYGGPAGLQSAVNWPPPPPPAPDERQRYGEPVAERTAATFEEGRRRGATDEPAGGAPTFFRRQPFRP